MIGVFHPGASVVHRCPALVKLAVLALALAGTTVFATAPVLVAAAAVALVLFAVARIPFRLAWRQVAPILWILALAVPVQWLFSGWEAAALMAARLLLAVTLAALYTLTTTVTATLDAVQMLLRPLRRWVDADRIGVMLALTIRCVPLLADLVGEVLQARRARGAEGSPRALAVPVMVRTLRAADELGEALMARGVDD